MRSNRLTAMLNTRHLTAAAVLIAAALAGCSTGGGDKAAPAPSAPAADQPAADTGTGEIGVSAGGVTTKIDVPAQSTEEQYAQSCLATKEWMTAKGGDPRTLVEPYLKELQGSTAAGPATFRKTWAELGEAERAAVIIAVNAAADGGC